MWREETYVGTCVGRGSEGERGSWQDMVYVVLEEDEQEERYLREVEGLRERERVMNSG